MSAAVRDSCWSISPRTSRRAAPLRAPSRAASRASACSSPKSTACPRPGIRSPRSSSKRGSVRPRWASTSDARCRLPGGPPRQPGAPPAMPEGDTIFRAARTLDRALAGKPVVRFESMFPSLTRVHEDQPLTGRTVERVESAGKHLLMRFSDGLVLRTHMRMNGRWHIYRPGERWRRPRRDMRVLIATSEFEAVGFNIPVAEFIRERDLPRNPALRRVGPDLLSDSFDAAAAVVRLRARPDGEIADALLDQRVMAGIGNVYKSETLFACRVNPFVYTGTLDDAELLRLVETARRF